MPDRDEEALRWADEIERASHALRVKADELLAAAREVRQMAGVLSDGGHGDEA